MPNIQGCAAKEEEKRSCNGLKRMVGTPRAFPASKKREVLVHLDVFDRAATLQAANGGGESASAYARLGNTVKTGRTPHMSYVDYTTHGDVSPRYDALLSWLRLYLSERLLLRHTHTHTHTHTLHTRTHTIPSSHYAKLALVISSLEVASANPSLEGADRTGRCHVASRGWTKWPTAIQWR